MRQPSLFSPDDLKRQNCPCWVVNEKRAGWTSRFTRRCIQLREERGAGDLHEGLLAEEHVRQLGAAWRVLRNPHGDGAGQVRHHQLSQPVRRVPVSPRLRFETSKEGRRFKKKRPDNNSIFYKKMCKGLKSEKKDTWGIWNYKKKMTNDGQTQIKAPHNSLKNGAWFAPLWGSLTDTCRPLGTQRTI